VRVVDGAGAGERFGSALAGPGDMNGDGRDDLAAGAPGGAGVCRLYYGGAALTPGPVWTDGTPGGQLGAALAGTLDPNGVPEILAGAPLQRAASSEGAGAVTLLGTPRYVLESPADGDVWFSGAIETIRWRGAEPAHVTWSVDGGRTWTGPASSVGGSDENQLDLHVPLEPADSVLVRLTPSRAGVSGELIANRNVRIRTAGTLAFFRYELGDDGVHLSWSAEPGIGPQGWAGYRIYRSVAGSAFEAVTASAITDTTLVISENRRGIEYELRAVNGLGDEQLLGRVTIPEPAAPIRIWPVPSDDWRPLELAIAPPVGSTGRTPEDFTVWIYDLRGRRVRGLASGSLKTLVGVLRLTWDRTLIGGAQAQPGIYFVRAEVPSAGWRAEQRMVILR